MSRPLTGSRIVVPFLPTAASRVPSGEKAHLNGPRSSGNLALVFCSRSRITTTPSSSSHQTLPPLPKYPPRGKRSSCSLLRTGLDFPVTKSHSVTSSKFPRLVLHTPSCAVRARLPSELTSMRRQPEFTPRGTSLRQVPVARSQA